MSLLNCITHVVLGMVIGDVDNRPMQSFRVRVMKGVEILSSAHSTLTCALTQNTADVGV